MDIKSIYGKVLFTSEAETVAQALRDANLRGANLPGARIPVYAKWNFAIQGDILHIGCKSKTFTDWDLWFKGSEEFSTSRSSEDFKRLKAMYIAYKTYYEYMKS